MTVAPTAATSEILKSLGEVREVAPDPVDGPLQEVEQDDRPDEVHQVDGLVRCVLLLATAVLVMLSSRSVAGETGLEPAALRFGDGCSTN